MSLRDYYNAGVALQEPLFDPGLSNRYKEGRALAQQGYRISNRSYHIGASGIAGTGVFSDVPEEADRLGSEIEAFTKEMIAQIYHSDGSRDQVLNDWYASNWVPFLNEWNQWKDKHSHWYHNMFLSAWHEVNEFRARFIMLHDAAKRTGFATAIEPTPIRRDAFQQVGDAFQRAIDQVWSLVKIVVIAGVIIIGIVFVSRYL